MDQEAFKLIFPPNADSDLMHRVLNYMEDVYRYLQNRQFGSIENIDHYSNGIFGVNIKSKHLRGEVKSELIRQLKKHNLNEIGVIENV